MANIQKCLILLEGLKQPTKGAQFNDTDYSSLTQIIQKQLQIPIAQLNETQLFQQLSYPPVTELCPKSWQCNSYLIYLLRSIVDNCVTSNDQTNSLDQLLSPQHMQLILVWINHVASIHLVSDLDSDMLKHSLLTTIAKPNPELTAEQRRDYMGATVRAFSGFFRHPAIVRHDPLELVIIQYVSVLHDLLGRQKPADDHMPTYSQQLDALFDASNLKYTRILLILKANKTLRPEQNERLHRDLLLRVQTPPHGFECLVRNILPAAVLLGDNVQEMLRSRSDIVSGICGRRGHTLAFYEAIRRQCEVFIAHCLRSKADRLYVIVCMDTLCKIHSLPDDGGGQRRAIETFVFGCLHTLAVPGDILAGCVVMEHDDLINGLEVVRLAFCSPHRTSYKLPSRLLIPWLPLLLQLDAQMKSSVDYKAYEQCDHSGRLIVYCLANQSRSALGYIVDSLLHQQYTEQSWQLHPRIRLNAAKTRLSCTIAPSTAAQREYSPSAALLDILKQSEHNILIYSVFLHLLEQLAVVEDSAPDASSTDALPQDMDELETLMKCVFDKRIAIISTLTDLIEYKPFHSQFNENPAESLECMTGMLRRRVQQLRTWRQDRDERQDDTGDSTYIVIVSIIREFVDGLVHRGVQQYPEFGTVLQEYAELTLDSDVRAHLQAIMRMLSVEPTPIPAAPSQFEAARILCSANEPYLKVYGLTQMTKLVRAKRDEEVHAMRHTILMLAMDGLKHEDSYVFLNCIRLLVALVGPLQSEVMQTMVAEFQLADAEVDYRLKVCEGIVKVAEHLGPLIFSHRDILIPCFLVGCSYENDDLRTASLSSMATVVRLLAYQVHAFFQELIDLTHRIITGDKHVPCRRGAVMMLSHLIQGFDELPQFEDILLPVYRALKYVVEHETEDGTTVIHARNGLDHLKLKVAAILTVDPQPREIQIFGINEPKTAATRQKKSILEIL